MNFPSKAQANLVVTAMTTCRKTMGEKINDKYLWSSESTPPYYFLCTWTPAI